VLATGRWWNPGEGGEVRIGEVNPQVA